MSVQRREAVEQQTAVYHFYDSSDQLLYVGITKNTKARFAYHAKHAADTWWPLVARHTIAWRSSRSEAAAEEVAAIRTESPLYNKSDKPSPTIVSESAAVRLGAGDFDGHEWVTPAEIARRVVSLGIRKSFTRARVMQLAQTDPTWPVPRDQWRSLANMWLFPWPPVEEYFRTRVVQQGMRTDLGEGLLSERVEGALRERFSEEAFTARDMAGALECSYQTACRLVKSLEEAGTVRRTGVKPNGRSGRQPATYGLSAAE